jgi:phosphatidylserine/phosphatidylglycerophosphate/cardiolipin synthase-like enzyme
MASHLTAYKLTIALLFISNSYLLGAIPSPPDKSGGGGIVTKEEKTTYLGSREVKIGDAKVSIAFSPSAGYKEEIWAMFTQATHSIKICMYNLDHPRVIELIKESKNRGIDVEVILYHDPRRSNAQRNELVNELEKISDLYLIETDIIVDHERSIPKDARATMHHKFIVTDQKKVWTSSGNLTTRSLTYNDEASLSIEHPDIAYIFDKEFEGLKKGHTTKRNTKIQKVDVGGGHSIDILMLPLEGATDYIIDLIKSAKVSITLLMSEITEERVAQSLIDKHKEGVKVSVLTDMRGTKFNASSIWKLQEAGVNVVFSKNDHSMHQRSMAIDSKRVMVSSGNFSWRGLTNSLENIVLLENSDLAQEIELEFVRCSQAIPYRKSKWGEE